MRVSLLFLFTFLVNVWAQAQRSTSENIIDIDFGISKLQGTFSTAIVHNWYVGKNKKIIVGAGARLTVYTGGNQYYVTAPAELTSGDTGPLVIFKENIIANMDTFLISKPRVISLNGMINLGYRFSERFSIGFNIDAIGASFGSKKSGTYINGVQRGVYQAKPTSINYLLVSDNDRGSLNSQLYAKLKASDIWSAKAGMQFLFTEYTTNSKVQQYPQANDRFRKKSLMLMVGASITIR